MAICKPFADVLAAGRTQFNQRATEARRRFPAFDTAAFADFLQTGVDAVVGAVAASASDRVASTTLVAYDIALELVGHGLAGPIARSALVEQVWRELAPAYARLISECPAEVLGLLSNAAVNIGKMPSARPAQWLREMTLLAPRVETLPQLRALGQLLAWRAGIAHFRLGAIEAAGRLPEPLALAAMHVGDSTPWATIRERLLADPWWSASAADRLQAQAGIDVGRFTGFGGEFVEPPEARACPEGFYIKSGSRYHFLIADIYGAVLHTASREEFDLAGTQRFPKVATLDGSQLVISGRRIMLDLPAEQLAITCNTHTVAITSPFTHAIRLLPLQ